MADPTQFTRRGFSCTQAVIKINGITVGWATDVSFEETYAQFPIEVLNDAYVQGHELTAIRVSGSFGKFRIYLEPLSQTTGDQAIWYDQNQDTAQIIRFLEKEMVIADGTRPDDAPPLLVLIGFKPSSRRISVSTGSIMMENVSFVGQRLLETKAMQPVPLQDYAGGPGRGPISE